MAKDFFNLQNVDDYETDKNSRLLIKEKDFGDKNIPLTIKKIYEARPNVSGIVFEQCCFNKVIFEGITIDKSLEFNGCIFYDEVSFKKCNFINELSFIRSIFYKTTAFDDCCYANNWFNFSEIETKPTCKYFKIVNTHHNQRYDRPVYTILDFSKAVFNSEVAFTELTDLSFTFNETIFNNKFYFTNTRLGAKSIIENVRYPRVVVGGNLTKIDLKRCLQTLLGALLDQRILLYDADKIKERIKALDGEEEIIQLDKVYSEQQMCDEAHIGRPALQKLKSEVRKGKIQFRLPKPCCEKPLKYKRDEVEAFIKEVDRYRSEQKSKKKKK